ncbi:surface-adhesin E family protein [Geomonas subterranea]|uniref:surface-adhesin E family protein n=1 Tax=Geomonas subterranea TaxID=2847989 RepID=UPI001CD27B56|nr:surface-adhesin E family protein [Geomonas fuzhouensis]
MKILMILALVLIASTSFAGEKKKTAKEAPNSRSLQEKWDADASLLKLDCNDSMCAYGVKGSAQIVDADSNIRSAWVAFLYTDEGRKGLSGALKGSYYSKEKWNINCNDATMNVSSVNYYDAKGSPVSSYGNDERWSDIVPGSFGETVAAIVCTLEDDGDEQDNSGAVPGESPPQEGTPL